MKRKKLRVIVRPWQPTNLPFPVSQQQLKAFIQTHAHLFDEILYLGWVRRKENEKRIIKFIVATGPSRLIAKKRFKESIEFGSAVWEITNTQFSHQVLPDHE